MREGSVSEKDFEQLEAVFGEKLNQGYFLRKFGDHGEKSRTKVTDMSRRAFKVLLAAHRVWDLHFRHQPHAVHFYWKSAKTTNGSLGSGSRYLGGEKVADIIFFDGIESRNIFLVEIVILFERWSEITARVRWCRLFKDRDGKNRDATWDEKRNYFNIMGESYIRI